MNATIIIIVSYFARVATSLSQFWHSKNIVNETNNDRRQV